jgi:hypothetical protein
MGLLDQTQQTYYDGNDHGNYQFTSLNDIISQFIIAYVGEDKIISKIKRTDVAFHAQRAMQELSFDTFKSCKSQEITVPASLQMILPQDYVNYTKISWVDSAGIKHLLYPASKTSNPTSPLQTTDGDFILQSIEAIGTLVSGSADVALDTEYKNIEVGMIVSGPYIPEGTFVRAISNTSSITTITMHDGGDGAASVAVTPLIPLTTTDIGNTGTTLTFSTPDDSLIYSEDSSYIIDNLSWAIGDSDFNFKITGTASELTDIKIGMLVSHDNFPIGTTVTNVFDTTIVISTTPDNIAAVTGAEVTFISTDLQDSTTWSNYKSGTPSENQDDYQDDTYWPMDGERYGLDPQHAQANGSFYIDNETGKIHFSSNISGETVILDYISDSLGTDGEMQVHKFAEEAMYKWIAHAILATRANTQEYIVNRFRKERFAAVRTAKLRLSNIKLEEITQILRGKSKQIKH